MAEAKLRKHFPSLSKDEKVLEGTVTGIFLSSILLMHAANSEATEFLIISDFAFTYYFTPLLFNFLNLLCPLFYYFFLKNTNIEIYF